MQTLLFWKDELKSYCVKWHEEGEGYNVDEVYNNTWYECQNCYKRIDEIEKTEMLNKGEWRDQYNKPFNINNVKVKSVGFHINALYSPWVTWGEAAVKFLKSKDSPEEYMNFVNLWLGLPVKDLVCEKITDDASHIVSDYEQGIAPADASTVILTVDVQKYYLQYVVRAWSYGMESWLLREGQIDNFEDLNSLISSSYPVAGSEKRLETRLVLIDSGYRTDEVYDFVRRYPTLCRATKGSSFSLKTPYQASKIDVYPNGKKMMDGIALWLYDTDYWKDAFVRRILLTEGTQDNTKWHVYRDITPMYISQLTAEEKVQVKNRNNGHITNVWQLKQGRKRNEVFDLEVMNFIGADMLGLKYLVGHIRPQVHDVKEVPKVKSVQYIKKVVRSNWMTSGRRGF
jgi:phage terminase large subunit GpA-like protein